MGISAQHNIGSYVVPVTGIFPESASAGVINGSSIDRVVHNMPNSCVLHQLVGAESGAPTAVSVQTKLQHSPDNSTWGDYAINATVQETAVLSASGSENTANIDLSSAYTFSAADEAAGVNVIISYAFFQASGGNRITAVNQLMGSSPTFRMNLANNYAGNNMCLTLYAAIPTKMSWDFKNEDFTVPDFEFSAFTDSLGRFFDWSSSL